MCFEASLNRRNFRKHTITDAGKFVLRKCQQNARSQVISTQFRKNPNQVPGRLHLTQFWKTSTKRSKCVRKAIRIHFNLKRAEKDVKCDPENEIEPLFVKVFRAAFGKSKQIN